MFVLRRMTSPTELRRVNSYEEAILADHGKGLAARRTRGRKSIEFNGHRHVLAVLPRDSGLDRIRREQSEVGVGYSRRKVIV